MRAREHPPDHVLNLRIGEVVEVRSEREILATLDENGELDALPFMPEMLQFCGQRFKVYKLALKLCDTIDWTGMHRMQHAVHLELVRCDGQAHGGCQAGCLIYWKEAWLRRVDADEPDCVPPSTPPCTRAKLMTTTHKGMQTTSSNDETFSCQATELIRAAPRRIPYWDIRQYAADVWSGNAGALAMIRTLCVGLFNKYQGFSKGFLPRPLLIRGGKRFPFIEGKLEKTPTEILNLQPGELVRVKTKEEIFRTLDENNSNRGLSFDAEMLIYCGRQARVLRRVENIINEKTGKLMYFGNPCIVLENVICCGDYHQHCPRSIYPYWREIWLERVSETKPRS